MTTGVATPMLLPGGSLPAFLALASSVTAAAFVVIVLHESSPVDESARRQRAQTQTPERVAESFITAYDQGDYQRALPLTTPPLSRRVRGLADGKISAHPRRNEIRSFVIQETFLVSQRKLRLLGVLVRPGEAEADGWPAALLVTRRGDRFLVEDLTWPKGPPTEKP